MAVIIGMDPHKRSATIEIIDDRAQVLAVGRFDTDKAGYAEMLAAGRQYPDRVWAVEGCNGIGKHIAHRLVHDGETVLDVPPKLSAQVRVFATGNGRKTDPVDAHSVAMVALRSPKLVQVEVDAALVVMGMLVDRRDELGRDRRGHGRAHHAIPRGSSSRARAAATGVTPVVHLRGAEPSQPPRQPEPWSEHVAEDFPSLPFWRHRPPSPSVLPLDLLP